MSLRITQQDYDNYIARNQKIDDPGNGTDEPESKLTSKIEKWFKERGYPHFHDRSRGKNRKGFLDHVGALPNGVTVWIEDKTKTGTHTKEQRHEIRMLKYLGHVVFTVRSYKQFIDKMRELGY